MGLLLVLLLVGLALFVVGFLLKALWIAAGVVLGAWLVAFAGRRVRSARQSGSR